MTGSQRTLHPITPAFHLADAAAESPAPRVVGGREERIASQGHCQGAGDGSFPVDKRAGVGAFSVDLERVASGSDQDGQLDAPGRMDRGTNA